MSNVLTLCVHFYPTELKMTSLAKQLERLAVPHIRAVYGEDKRRKSLLFDPKEAAALDKEAIYAIGGCVFDTNIFLLKC